MSVFYDNNLTDAGRALLAHVQAGAVFVPTRIVIGSGCLPKGVTTRTITEVVQPVKSLEVNKKSEAAAGTVVFGGMYTNMDITQPFYFRELALYAKGVEEGQNKEEADEVLYSYGNAGEDAELMAAYSTETLVERQIDLVVYVGSDAKIKLELATGALVTPEQLKEYAAPKKHTHAAGDVEETTGETTEAAQRRQDEAMKGLKQGLANHLENKDNPHKVTAQQVGADPQGSAGEVEQKLTRHSQDTAAHVQGANEAEDGTFYGKQGGVLGFYKASSMEITTLPLPAAKWAPQPNQAGVYRQQVTQQDIVSQVQPNTTALDSFADLATEELLEYQGVEKLWLENQNGTVMALAKGAQPAADIAIQVRVVN